jgi:hypothetical protein
MSLLLAQLFAPGRPWGIVEVAVFIVAAVAIVALVLLFCRVAGYSPPQWVFHAIGIVIAAVLVIWLIRFVAGM